MTVPCAQKEVLASIKSDTSRALELIGTPADPLRPDAPATGVYAIVASHADLAARVAVLEAAALSASERRRAVWTNAAKILIPFLIGAAASKTDALIAIAHALVK